MMHLQLKQIFLTPWTEDLTDGAGMVVDLLVLKFSMSQVDREAINYQNIFNLKKSLLS